MHNSLFINNMYSYTTILDMFRALTCPSSGGPIVFSQHLVTSLSVNGSTIQRLRAYARSTKYKMPCLFWFLATCSSPVPLIRSVSVVVLRRQRNTNEVLNTAVSHIFKSLSCIYQTIKRHIHWFFFYLSGSERYLFLLTWRESKCTQANTKLQSTMWLPLLLSLASTEICCHTESNMKCFRCHVFWYGGRFTSLILFKESVLKKVTFGVWARQWLCVAGNITCRILPKLCESRDELRWNGKCENEVLIVN
jgi:hypothetical protein